MALDSLLLLIQKIDGIPIYGIHTHANPRRTFTRNLRDIIGYHYYTELTNCGQYRPGFADVTDAQVVERLPLIASTVQ